LDEEAVLMSFNAKWRNSMRKGIKLGVKIKKADGSKDSLDTLMRSYSELQSARGFDGISDELLRSLFRQQGFLWDFNLYFAYHEDDQNESPIGVLVSIRTGNTTTYIIGISNDIGRSMQANSVLLWEAIVRAKRDGCSWFDIGGLTKSTPKGVASFKKGLNARPYSLTGDWFRLNLPFF
jgi:lipid II:glycine glycyltransferase (peptidoglycan interpeptide bridge formation enzyme)